MPGAAARALLRGGGPVFTVTGAASFVWNLHRGPLLLTTPGTYTIRWAHQGFRVRFKGVAGGQAGLSGIADSTRSQGGGGGGGGGADLTGVLEVVTMEEYTIKVGDVVAGTSTNGTDGEVQVRRGGGGGTLLLDLGSGIRATDHLGNTGVHRAGLGGVARVGSAGAINGGSGGIGGAWMPLNEPSEASHNPLPGETSATGAGGGGGGGGASQDGRDAGSGAGQTGGTGGLAGNSGTSPSNPDPGWDADPGTNGAAGNSGGGGGAGGGAPLTGYEQGGALVTRRLGGGGGGGAGTLSTNGDGGPGGKAGVVIELQL